MSPLIDTDPIGSLEKALQETTDPAQQWNIPIAIEILKSGGEIPDGMMSADGRLVNFGKWKPSMEPWLTIQGHVPVAPDSQGGANTLQN